MIGGLDNYLFDALLQGPLQFFPLQGPTQLISGCLESLERICVHCRTSQCSGLYADKLYLKVTLIVKVAHMLSIIAYTITRKFCFLLRH